MKRFAAILAWTAVVSFPAFGQKVVSQIAAKVNKDIVLASEIKKAEDDIRTDLTADPKLKGAPLQQAIDERSKNALRDLIDKYLILQEANDLGLDAGLEVIKQMEQLRVENNFDSEDALEAAMIKQGVSPDDVKDNIRYKNLRALVLRQEVTGKIVITTEEMRVYYDAHKADFDRPPGVSIGMIAVSIDGLSPSELEAKNKTMADAFAALNRGEDFGDVAHKYSEDPSGQDGGTLGFFERNADGTLGLASPEMEDIVGKLTKGKFTDVITNPQNHTLVILKLLDKHDGGILPFEIAQTDIFNELMDERAEPKVRAYLTKLRAEGYIEVYPGFTDTGAATKPVRASETTPPNRENRCGAEIPDLMRLDLFLKWSRVILRRSLAKEVCDAGRVKVNGVEARAGREIRIADTVEIDFPRRQMKCRVRSLPPHAPGKEGAREMLEILEDRRTSSDSE